MTVTTLMLVAKAGCVSVFSLPCFEGIHPNLFCLHRDSIDLKVSIHTEPLFRGEGDKGAF